jgi:copper(I)-binding protein
MNARPLILGLLLIGSSSAAVASASACKPVLEKTWIRAAPPKSMQLAGYATLENRCPKVLTVSAVSSRDFGMAMIHETVIEKGVSKMRHVGALAIPAKGRVAFSPGGGHLMLMMPARELKLGDKVELTFALATGEKVSAEFPVLRAAPVVAK